MEDQAFQDLRQELLERAREASTSPGVYLMKDASGGVLYVGKAKNLRNRIRSYFDRRPHEHPRTELLVGCINRFDVILTETESEALILECTLIKRHKPKYNIRLKDDKAYPYLKIDINQAYPRIEWTRRVRRDGARYFGPFPSAWSARQILEILNETFQLRDCSENTFRHRSRPCILFQIGRCTAPCVQKISTEDYQASIREVIAVLEGKSNRLRDDLTGFMKKAAEEEEFEAAAYYRDQIKNLDLVTQTQIADEAGSHRHRDVIAISRKDTDAHGAIMHIRGGRLIAVKHYHLQNTDPSQSNREVMGEFLAQHYLALDGREEDEGPLTVTKAQEVLLAEAPEDLELIEKTLGLTVTVPANEHDRQLMSVAQTNADYALEQAKRAAMGHGIAALEEVQFKLSLNKLPTRIECYDISNIQGDDAVASRVVFTDGAPNKNLYRRYKIRTVQGQNDFAMMKEVLSRRFSHADETLPDLVVVDGGKGQLAQAEKIMEELQIQGVGICGLAKARTERDFQATEVESSMERVFIPGRKNPVALPPHTEAYKLLTHVRDEAHRFAVSYHRVVRAKRTFNRT